LLRRSVHVAVERQFRVAGRKNKRRALLRYFIARIWTYSIIREPRVEDQCNLLFLTRPVAALPDHPQGEAPHPLGRSRQHLQLGWLTVCRQGEGDNSAARRTRGVGWKSQV